jgi:oligopeptide/dipeptide ABC transporter ATP-binding protein
MSLLPPGGAITDGDVTFSGEAISAAGERRMRSLRGGDIAMVFQDPFTSLNPSMRVGDQIAEAITLHTQAARREALAGAIRQLEAVRVPSPRSTARKFPHQLSGGQRQRVMVAMAFACKPKVLIADEPTTALDVTLQAQILSLLRELQAEHGTAVILISHDIGVIGSVANRVAVFYAGRVIEEGDASAVLEQPAHPYTRGLLASLPGGKERLHSISGQPPNFGELSGACSFAPRCAERFTKCEQEPGLLDIRARSGKAACWLVEGPYA